MSRSAIVVVMVGCAAGGASAQTPQFGVAGFGSNSFDQSTVPDGLGPITAISAGYAHSAAVTTSGTVACWGYNGAGQSVVPTNLYSVTSVAAGGFHTVALRAGGSLVCWGSAAQGQCSPPRHTGDDPRHRRWRLPHDRPEHHRDRRLLRLQRQRSVHAADEPRDMLGGRRGMASLDGTHCSRRSALLGGERLRTNQCACSARNDDRDRGRELAQRSSPCQRHRGVLGAQRPWAVHRAHESPLGDGCRGRRLSHHCSQGRWLAPMLGVE